MKLAGDFTVSAPPEQTWSALLDVPRLAGALPGATLDPDAGDGAYRGSMKLTLGPLTADYAGTARLLDADDDERIASFYVQGRERRGQGMAAATITTRVAPAGGGTRVAVETDVRISGGQAELGAGAMEERGRALLADLAARLEQDLIGEQPSARELDLVAEVVGPLSERALLVVAGVAVGLLLGRRVWRRR